MPLGANAELPVGKKMMYAVGRTLAVWAGATLKVCRAHPKIPIANIIETYFVEDRKNMTPPPIYLFPSYAIVETLQPRFARIDVIKAGASIGITTTQVFEGTLRTI